MTRDQVQAQLARARLAQVDAHAARQRLRRSVRRAVSSPRGMAVGFGVGAAIGRSIGQRQGGSLMALRLLLPFIQLA